MDGWMGSVNRRKCKVWESMVKYRWEDNRSVNEHYAAVNHTFTGIIYPGTLIVQCCMKSLVDPEVM